MRYIIGIGTNIGDRKGNIDGALEALSHVPKTRVIRISSIYETEPVGYKQQDSFYNACIETESSLEPNEMLGVCLGIEAAFGRVRKIKNGPRILDLDLILCDSKRVDTPNLTLPHPRFKERRFVLAPLLELFPDGTAYGVEFKTALDKIVGQEVKKIDN